MMLPESSREEIDRAPGLEARWTGHGTFFGNTGSGITLYEERISGEWKMSKTERPGRSGQRRPCLHDEHRLRDDKTLSLAC
jgi:hypothetical protein